MKAFDLVEVEAVRLCFKCGHWNIATLQLYLTVLAHYFFVQKFEFGKLGPDFFGQSIVFHKTDGCGVSQTVLEDKAEIKT